MSDPPAVATGTLTSSEPGPGHTSGPDLDLVLEDKVTSSPSLGGLDQADESDDRATLTDAAAVKGARGLEDADDGGDDKPEMSELKTHHSNGLVDQTAYLPPRQIIVVFLALTLVIFLSFLDQTIVSTALPNNIVSLQERGKYQGINEITIAVANGVVTVIVFFLPLKSVNGNIREKLLQIDYMGSLLTIVGAGLIIFPLNWGGISYAWNSGQVIGCLIGGVLLFGVLMLWEWKCARIPIVPPSIFKTSTVNGVMLCTFIAGMVILTQLYYIPQYLQIVRGVSAIRSGVLVLPLLVLVTFSVFTAGQLMARTGEYKLNVVMGYSLWTIGLGLFSTLDQNTSTAKLIGFMVIGALGQGQTLQTTMVAAQAAVQRSEMSVVTSTRNFLRSLGGALALAIAGAIIHFGKFTLA
ncbi:hypothetical protein RQP46_003879 [Phenoliferia psychrophenolica]